MAVDYFLKIDGIQGESTDAKHKGEISVLSWSWGETQATVPGAGRAGKVSGVSSIRRWTETNDRTY